MRMHTKHYCHGVLSVAESLHYRDHMGLGVGVEKVWGMWGAVWGKENGGIGRVEGEILEPMELYHELTINF